MPKRKQNQKIGYLFVGPLLLVVAVFLLYPFINGFVLSFYSTKYGFGDMDFIGLDNYRAVMQSEHFGIALKNSIIWVVVGLILNNVFPTLVALLLNRSFRGKTVAMGAIMIPWMTPVVGFAMMWKWLLEPELGVVNAVLKNLGLAEQGINFLGDPALALPTCIFLNFLQFFPFGVLLISSALSVIPEEQYEAMRVDGANAWQIFTNLTLPSIGAMIGFIAFLGVVWTFSNYSLIYILTKGGPSYSTYTVPIMIYEKAFSEFKVGQSCALAATVGVVLIVLGALFLSKTRNKDAQLGREP